MCSCPFLFASPPDTVVTPRWLPGRRLASQFLDSVWIRVGALATVESLNYHSAHADH